MTAHQELLDYISTARSKGFSDDAIKTALRNTGWDEMDIQRAFAPLTQRPESHPLSPVVILLSIALFIFFGGGAAYGLYWYQTQLKIVPTPTPTLAPTPTEFMPASLASSSGTVSSTPSAQVSSTLSFAHNGFGFDVLKTLIKTDAKSNVIISPTSIALALSMTYNGASESTKLAMAKTLKLGSMDTATLNADSNLLIKFLTNPDPQVTLSVANSIWAKKGVLFLPEFLSTNKTFYNAGVQSLDFAQPSAADTINAWVSKNTKGKIPTIVEKPIDPVVVMYLINAIYFYGTWTHEFDPTLTATKPFTLSTNTIIQHLFMKQERKDYLYQETALFQAVQLPYGKNKRLSMIIFLPKTTLAAFMGQLTHATWTSWMKSFAESEGVVYLPKFKIEYKTSLKTALTTLGMANAFSGTADFSGMRKEKDVLISDVIHKTFIDVSEKGTEAAAATSVELVSGGGSLDKKIFLVEVNKPFFFTITDIDSGEILFMGSVNDPSK